MISLQYKYTTNSSWSSDAYMRQHNMPTLLQIMACHLFSAKTLSGPMLPYCLLDPKEHFSLKFYFKFKSFHSRKCTWEMSSAKWRPFCLGLNALRMYFPLSSMITMRLWPHDSYWLWRQRQIWTVYDDVIMGAIASQIPSLTIVFSTVYSKKTSKLRVPGLMARTGDFPAQMASNSENVSIWWRHHSYW